MRKKNKSKSLLKAEKDFEKFLKKKGYKGNKNAEPINEIPDYKCDDGVETSDKICGHYKKRTSHRYTGNEIAGIATMHKSNAVPIRKNTNEAKDIAKMRR